MRGREAADLYTTPPSAVRALLAVENFQGTVWEPACGMGHISEELEVAGLDVYSSDLNDYGYGSSVVDFFTSGHTSDNIITNPPYKFAQEFIERSLDATTGKVAMLLKLQFLEGQKRKSFFESTPLKKVYVFSNRVNPWRGGRPLDENGKPWSGTVAYAWFVWDHDHQGPPEIQWITH